MATADQTPEKIKETTSREKKTVTEATPVETKVEPTTVPKSKSVEQEQPKSPEDKKATTDKPTGTKADASAAQTAVTTETVHQIPGMRLFASLEKMTINLTFCFYSFLQR
jgi:hypothetical protein